MKERKKEKVCALLLTGCILLLCLYVKRNSAEWEVSVGAKPESPVVVLDPGHGGIDPGKVGVSGSYEKDINLSIAKLLKEYLKKEKVSVVMTREEDAGLYEENDTNKKSADMRARMELMNQSGAALIVSIHQNSFTSAESKGAQVFYHASSEKGEWFAKRLQEILISEVDADNHRQAKPNESYYILRKSEKTAVIVECGFLSNPAEEKLLLEPEYQEKLAKAIGKGIMEYLSEEQQKNEK